MTAAPANAAAKIRPVILSGGAGTRLWPASRAMYPKQFQRLTGARSLLQDTALRVHGNGFTAPIVVCNADHRFIVDEQLAEADVVPEEIILEPCGRNTAPAVTVAALWLADQSTRNDSDELLLVLPSDHFIADTKAFRDAIDAGIPAAQAGHIVTFGIQPDAPNPEYGYITAGAPCEQAMGCRITERFVEKPDESTAQSLIDKGDTYWNSGIFLAAPSVILDEIGALSPNVLAGCAAAFAEAERDLGYLRLAATAFGALPTEAIDRALMEKSERTVVVPMTVGWNDLASWQSLWKSGNKDANGNVLSGNVIATDTTNCIVRSNGYLTTTLGIDDAAVVVTDDAVLVASMDRIQDVPEIVDAVATKGGEQHLFHPTVYRPWGSFKTICAADRFQVKEIVVKPDQQLSLQKHFHRAEHWVVVQGTAKILNGDKELLLHENESTYIPLGTVHRLENPGKIPLKLIEVQSGSYLGEDDIVRLEDTYGRN